MRNAGKGTWFRAARLKAGLSVTQAAASLGVHAKTFENWEMGRVVPSPALADRIAEVLHQPIAEVAIEIINIAIAIRGRKVA